MTNEKDLIKKPTEGEITASSSSKFSTEIEEVMEDNNFEYDSDISSEYLSDSNEEEWNEKEQEYFRLGQELSVLDKRLELSGKYFEAEVEKLGKMGVSSEEYKELKNELCSKLDIHDKKVAERNKIGKRFFELKREIERDKELSASTGKGKEVIKAEISKELIEAKEIFANFQISETSELEIKNKLQKTVRQMWETRASSDCGIYTGVSGGLFTSEEKTNRIANERLNNIANKLSEKTKKLVNNSISDLEKTKKKVLKKMDAVIEARGKEVTEAKKVIEALEIVNKERKNEIKDLREKSSEEIRSLQISIKELRNRLAEYENKKKEFEKDAKKYFQNKKNWLKPDMPEGENSKTELTTYLEKIKELEFYGKWALEGWESEKKKVEDTEKELKRETERLNNEIARKENELVRKMKIADDLQRKLNGEIREWEKKYNQAKDEKHELDLENVDLKVENKTSKDKREKAEAEARKWKNEYESEKALHEPTWIQKGMKFLGVEKLQNAIATSASIVGCLVILWGISWMWKNVIKETWKNFKGEPEDEPRPRRKERVKYEDYEEIVETKEKPQSLPEKQPTIIINNRTPAEKEGKSPSVVSKGEVKQEEILTQISDEKETPPIEKKNESRKKKKNKKKVKGDR